MNTRRFPSLAPLLLALVSVLALAAPALAVDYYLCAGATTVAMPDGATIPMWGYALDNDSNLANGCGGAVQVPGPRLTLPVGDSTLRIFLRNDLPDPDGVGPQLAPPTSIVVAGLPMPAGSVPVRHTSGPFAGRVRSFTLEAQPGGQQTYTWNNVAPGTYVYESGTHQQVQVQMGLYGPVSKDAALGEAYAATGTSPAVAYTKQQDLFFSEVDPALHTAVATGTYGTPGGPTSTLAYQPKYFLINGQPFSATSACIGGLDIGDNVLLRLYNGGLRELAPMMLGSHFDVVAEGGNKLPFRYTQYSVLLQPGSTKDVVFTPTRNGRFPLIERRLNLTNAATPDGGMQTCLAVGPQPPTANLNSYTVAEGGTLNVPAPGVLGNDFNFDAPPGAVLLTGPTRASAFTLNADGSFSYTHDGSETTSDSFTYQVSNANGTADAVVTIAVTPVNDVPVATNDSYTAFQGQPLTVNAPGVLANDTDPDGNPLAVATTGAVATVPAGSGSVTRNANGSFTYTPAAGFSGTAAFTYQATDGTAQSNAATVTITVSNQPPVAGNNAYTVNEDALLSIAVPGVLGNDSDPEGGPITAVLVTGPTSGTLTLNPNGSFTYQGNPNFFGTDSFTYQAQDVAGALSPVATVTITVTAVNNDPPITVADTYSTNINTPLTIAAPGILANDSDPDGQPITAQLQGTPVGGTVTFVGGTGNGNGGFTFTPTTGFTGVASFQYRARSANNTVNRNGNTVTVTINVSAGGQPVGAADSYTTAEDTPLTVAAPGVLGNDTDPENSPLTAVLVAGPAPASGTLALNANGSFTFTPALNFNGNASFTYRASDGTLQSNPVTVGLTVTPVNDPPTFTSTAGTTGVVGVPYTYDANATDPDGTALTFSLTQAPAGMTINATTGVISWTPAAGQTGPNPVTVRATDSGTPLPALFATQSFTITVAAGNAAPVAAADSYATVEDTPLTVNAPGVLGNDTDGDGNPLTVSTVGTVNTAPAGSGSVTRNANGSFTYTPAASFNGTATFTYRASDGIALSNVATVSITVTPVNDPPTFTSTAVTAATVGVPYTYDANAIDPEGTALTFALTVAPAGMTINATTGVISWTPTAGQVGPNAVTVQATDAGTPLPALSATQSFTVTVSAGATLPTGLVVAYNFEEATGTTVINRVTPGTVNGTLNGATRVATGRYGAALSFNGTNARVDAPDNAVIDLTTGMTLTAWVNPSALGSIWRTVILKETASGLAYSLYASDGTSGPSLPAGYVRIGTADQAIQSPSTLPLNTWSHLAVTYGGGTLTLYVNGTQVATRAQAGTITTSANALRIGGNAIWGEYFQGLIDETRIYNRALTPAEIAIDRDTPIP